MVTMSARASVAAPAATVVETLVDVPTWGSTFPAIHDARVVSEDDGALVIAVQHREGPVTNWLEPRPPGSAWLFEVKKHYDATFGFHVSELPDGRSICCILGELRLRGWRRLLGPFVGPYAAHRLRTLTLLPLRDAAEARALG